MGVPSHLKCGKGADAVLERSASGELPPANKLSDSESLFELILIAVSFVNGFQIFRMYIKTFTTRS